MPTGISWWQGDRLAQVAREIARWTRVPGSSLANRLAAVVAQMTLEVAALQAARLIVSTSTWPPPIGGSRPSSRYDAIILRAASSRERECGRGEEAWKVLAAAATRARPSYYIKTIVFIKNL